MSTHSNPSLRSSGDYDAIVVGAGFGGLYMLHRLREQGLKVIALEAGNDIGGTWYFNRYPGARCDIMSMYYSYSFSEEIQQEWVWSEKYSAQEEILRYAHFVADRLQLRSSIQLDTRVQSVVYEQQDNRWAVSTDRGELRARYCVMATGNLSKPNLPNIAGLDTFKGEVYHTANWPLEPISFAGKRVGVIGTGSTGIQLIPMIAEQAKHLYVFQRTPNFSIPARNAALTEDYIAETKQRYPELRRKALDHFAGTGYTEAQAPSRTLEQAERDRRNGQNWDVGGSHFLAGFPDLWFNKEENDLAAAFIHRKIHEIVNDPHTAQLLCPTDHHVGTKRICLDTNYYATYNRNNVSLVDIRSAPIETITVNGVVTSERSIELDCLIFATGFDAVTGALLSIDIRGRDGVTLKQHWQEGPRAYLGLMSAGFPNLFIMNGPSTPSALSNFFVMIEHNVEWIAHCIKHLDSEGLQSIEARRENEDRWLKHVSDVADQTLFPTAKSWFIGANIPGKPRVFMVYVGGFPSYAQQCRASVDSGYSDFVVNG